MAKMCEYLAQNVRREMKARGWTQTQLAEMCGWPPPRITEVLRGENNYRLSAIETLAEAFDVNPTVLLIPPAEKTSKKIPVGA